MRTNLRFRPLAIVALFAAVLALVGSSAPPRARAKPRPSPSAAPQTAADSRWKQVDALQNEQKLEAAIEIVGQLREEARTAGNEEEWTKALIREVQLRTALHGYETSVRFLREQPWPGGALHRSILNLFYGRSLATYIQAYAFEIEKRERVESRGVIDLKAWTKDQIAADALGAYAAVWGERETLGELPVGRLAEYVFVNTYPERIRGTVRDTVSYLTADLLADTSLWRVDQSNDLFRMSAPSLLADGQKPLPLADTTVHPLARLAFVLDDLEAWHRARGEQEAALQARLARVQALHEAFTPRADRAAIRGDLEARLPRLRDLEWWSMGMSVLADLVRMEDAPDALVRARAIAEQGYQAYPKSLGGLTCFSIVKSIEAPDFGVSSMISDAPQRRSLLVSHRNLSTLHFRAYAVDLFHRVETARDFDLLPSWNTLREVLDRQQPVASWSLALPATPDFRSHQTYVVPPLTRPGLYVIAASAREDFARESNRIATANLVVGDLVLASRTLPGTTEVTVLSGERGTPLAGAEVFFYDYNWHEGHRRLAARTTEADGLARFTHGVDDTSGRPGFFVARRGAEVAVDPGYFQLQPDVPRGETSAALIYTDRSVYRPQQKVLWKVVAYRGGGDAGRFRTSAQASVTVSLVDPNRQNVESKTVTTNAFGSASGEFLVPPGRPLGAWRLQSSPEGHAAIRVEEYKRPTFEVTFKDPEAALRLNRPARLSGEARYYFGLPVTAGQVRWKVTREPVYPWWWGLCFWGPPPAAQTQVIAAGMTALRDDGRFDLGFTPEADERDATPEMSYRYVATADVTDEGGETRSATRAVRLGFVAVEATLTSDVQFFRSGEPGKVKARRTSLDGVGREGAATWRLLELQQPARTLLPADQPLPKDPRPDAPRGFRTPGDDLRPRFDHRYSAETVLRQWADGEEKARGKLVHDAKGEAEIGLPDLHPGAYRLRYQTTDEFGARYETAREILVVGPRGVNLALPALLLAERASVGVGEKARIFVTSGLPGQSLVLETYRGGRRQQRQVLTPGPEGTVIELPVRDADRGGFGFNLFALADHQAMQSAQSVFVPWDDRELKVEFATFRDRLRPGARETWRVTVRGKEGPVAAGAAELLAYMYDRSLDVFAPHHPPSPLGLYPTLTGVVQARASLGGRNAVVVFDNGFASVPEPPDLEADRLRFVEDYGIGGPGVRARLQSLGYVQSRPNMPLKRKGGSAAVDEEQVADKQEMDKLQTAVAAGKPDAAAEPTAPAVELRSDFSETAFWRPHLLTDQSGAASFEFVVPDSVTSWSVWVHAVTRDLHGGSLTKEAKSVKELMVRPYLPRFLREGDEAEVKVVVNNASAATLSGRLSFEIEDPESGRSILADFGLAGIGQKPFSVRAGSGTTLTFPLKAPRRVGTVAFKVTATAGDWSDGELRPLPLLPGRMHLAQSRFVTLKGPGSREMRFPDLAKNDDPTRLQEQMVVTLDAQLFYGVLQALPYLIDYPYECTEQTLNRFLSTGILTSLFSQYPSVARMAQEMAKRDTRLETWDGADPNRKMLLEETPWLQEAKGGADPGAPLLKVLDPRIATAQRNASLAKLAKAQTSLGAFPWWPGGPPSPYMTLYILHGFSKGLEFEVEVPKDVVQRAWQYMHRHFLDELVREMMKDDVGWEFVSFLNYVLSSYPDATWSGGVFTDAERKQMADFSFRHWKQHSPFLKGYLTLTLHRMGRDKEARLVWDSVMDSAKTDTDLGTYWAPEDRAWLWYNDTVETQAFALRVLREMEPKDPRQEGLVQWLFLNKKLNHWKSTRATAEVVYSLAHYLKGTGALGVREDATVAVGPVRTTFTFEPDRYTGKKNQIVVPAEKIDPRSASLVSVEKTTPGFLFASATWHFSTERLPAEDRGDLLAVSRRYFRRETKGSETVLTPLADGAALAVGDEVEVQLSVRAKHAAEYVHLRDPRAAGLEPVSQVSRYRFDLGLVRYEEVRDSGNNFFFEWLPAGEYTLKYRLRASMAGAFKVSPATLQSMYAPEFTAYSAGHVVKVAAGR